MDDPNRSIAKRQIARLLGSSSTPFCVLSEDDTLVFANDAMGDFIGRSPDSLLGLKCQAGVPADGVADGLLSAFFALPIHWTRKELKLIPESGRPNLWPERQTANPSSEDNGDKTASLAPFEHWIRCLIPLEDQGCILCAFCPSSHMLLSDVFDEPSAIAQSIMRSNRAKYDYLDDLWYLQGTSANTHRALEQMQLAVANSVSLIVFGPVGSGRSWLAQSIHTQRRKLRLEGRGPVGDSMVRIDCSLMDSGLLTSMLEVVDESKGNARSPSSLLLDNLESLPDECVAMLASFLRSHGRTICLGTCDPEQVSHLLQKNKGWEELFARVGVLRMDLPALVDRLEDLPTLVSAWFVSQPEAADKSWEITNSFLDALMAYSWPGGIEEFAQSLTHACRQADDCLLTDKELPVNIRTCVSHIEQTQVDESVDLDSILEEVEKTMILRAMDKFPQNKSSAAKLLNISRARLLRRLQQWGFQSESTAAEVDDDTPDFSEVK